MELPPMSNWKPIETAPKDGSQIIVWIDPSASKQQHDTSQAPWWEPKCKWVDGKGWGLWDERWGWETDLPQDMFTHWMATLEGPK